MKKIKLNDGMYTLVDDADFEWLNQWKWKANKREGKRRYYALRGRRPSENILPKVVLMHRLIMETPKGVLVDHINGDSLDNRRKNLRHCSSLENAYNKSKIISHKGKVMTSKFKGVHWDKTHKKWRSMITNKGKLFHLGYFHDQVKAAKEYNKYAIKLFGEFSSLNVFLTQRGEKGKI